MVTSQNGDIFIFTGKNLRLTVKLSRIYLNNDIPTAEKQPTEQPRNEVATNMKNRNNGLSYTSCTPYILNGKVYTV